MAFAVMVALAPEACSQKANLADKGAACFLATDCAPGLVCVPQDNGARICTDDLTGVTGEPPMPPGDGAANADGGEGGTDAPPPTDGPPGDAPPTDTGTDTGQDTGAQDTGAG